MSAVRKVGTISSIIAALLGSAIAQSERFEPGPLIADYGKTATIDGREALPEGVEFAVAFDVARAAEVGDISRALDSGARFLNMHVAAGVPAERIQLAFVIHGPAVFDVVASDRYRAKHDVANASADLVRELVKNDVKIFVCGQSAAYYGVEASDLLPGVTMSLSAMTRHALLQQDGYTVNPF